MLGLMERIGWKTGRRRVRIFHVSILLIRFSLAVEFGRMTIS